MKENWESMIREAQKKELYLQFSIFTYEDWRTQPEEVIRCLNRCREDFGADRYPELPFVYGVNYTNGRRNLGEHTERRWNNIKKRLRAGEVYSVGIFRERRQWEFFFPLSMQFVHLNPVEFPGTKLKDIQFYICPSLMGERTAEEICDWFKQLFVQFQGIYGYMDFICGTSIGFVYQSTPHEFMNRWQVVVHEEEAEKMARGYFWGNILTEGQIEALGGEEEFLTHVPHYLIEKLPMEDGKMAYYVQIDEDVFEFHPEKYLELKEYLRPILPKDNLRRVFYELQDNPDKVERDRLVYRKDEMEQVTRELEANGGLRKILAYLGKLPENESQEKVTLMEVENIIDPPRAKSTQKPQDPPPMEIKKAPYIEFEYEDEDEKQDASCLDITSIWESMTDEGYEQLKDTIHSWFWLGYLGGYGGTFSDMYQGIWREENAVGLMVDIAASEVEEALKILERVLNGFAQEKGLLLQKLVLGPYDEA